jgi:hypothetical protein
MSDDVQKSSSKTDAENAGETSEGAKDGSYQDQYPQDGDLSLGLQFNSPAAENQETYPGQSWLPPDCRFPTEAPPGSDADAKDIPEDYPGKAWLPKGHVYPTPKKGPTLITHTMAMQNPGDCPKCRVSGVFIHSFILAACAFMPSVENGRLQAVEARRSTPV